MLVALIAMVSVLNPIDPVDALFLAFTKPGQGVCVPEYPRLLEELGNTIVAAGTFWEDWHRKRGRFDLSHMAPNWVSRSSAAFSQLLPTSGFESLEDVRNYLLQYFTESWVDAHLALMMPVFLEYDGVLFIHNDHVQGGFSNWETATHTLVEQDGRYAVVRTAVLHANWANAYAWLTSGAMLQYIIGIGVVSLAQYYFTFIDGRIDSVYTRNGWFSGYILRL